LARCRRSSPSRPCGTIRSAAASRPRRPSGSSPASATTGSGTLLGYAGLQFGWWFAEIADEIEIGWRFGTSFWGQGFATEAAWASLEVGFDDLGADRIVAVIEPENIASARVAERLGLVVERDTHEPEFDKALRVSAIDRAGFASRRAAHRAAPAPRSR
jgi:RimJ/RimL family protein N-acetyltransferase